MIEALGIFDFAMRSSRKGGNLLLPFLEEDPN
jgi:hypothetical protein